MTVGARVCYVAPYLCPEQPVCRVGVITAISGVSALIQFEDCAWPRWAPLERLQVVGLSWVQPLLLI